MLDSEKMQEVELYYIKENCPVFTTFLNHSSEEIESIKQKIIKYREEYPKSNKSNVKAWHSDYNTFERVDYFHDINLRILNECAQIINSFKKTKDGFRIRDMWANMYEKGDYTQEHRHFGCSYSCCFYVDVEENCSPIKFPPKLEIKPKNDMLVLFAGDTHHEVLPTGGKRTLIALNIDSLNRRSATSYLNYS